MSEDLKDECLTCECGCVTFYILRTGQLECEKCSAVQGWPEFDEEE